MTFLDKTYSVLIVSSSEKFSENCAALLPGTEYHPVTKVATSGEARRMLQNRSFDLVLINAPLKDEFGSRLATDICQSSNSGVLLFVKAEMYDGVYARVMKDGVCVLSKPTNGQIITQSLHILCSARERFLRMEEKQATVEEKIKEIRLVNRAKWLLIECLSMNEEEAHHYIEKQAMDMRLTKAEVATNIIKTYS